MFNEFLYDLFSQCISRWSFLWFDFPPGFPTPDPRGPQLKGVDPDDAFSGIPYVFPGCPGISLAVCFKPLFHHFLPPGKQFQISCN